MVRKRQRYLIEYVEKNGTDYRITEHVKLRWTMRIQPSKDLKQKHIENTTRVNLPDGYNRGLWNQEREAVFLVSKDGTVTTVIPEEDIPEDHTGLSEDMGRCRNCEALIMEECQLDSCRWCGESDYEEPVTSLNG
ncbi:hypothetical protein [Haloferax sp. Q22]|uniref:hypothetical protein n=1 Tax=Haloferax sp. (strain Q22) TaxID=1526048 RepID=UPI000A5C505D|nr:hypothetical protein [Haloferax sp. Q22]